MSTAVNLFLLVGLPCIALTACARVPFHFGILVVSLGQLSAFLFPRTTRAWNSMPACRIIPFTRLIHFFVAPLHYIAWPDQQAIWNWDRRTIRDSGAAWNKAWPRNN